jgi:NhaA family Na+:H+ antiporter
METRNRQGIYEAPLEDTFNKVLSPLEDFIHRQTTGGLLLMAAAILALLVANSPWAETYAHLLHLPIAIKVGTWTLDQSLLHWINDGLMALFFFVVGLELKREFLVGELAEPRQAVLPIVAALGGMAAPALIYYLFNHDGIAAQGWGVPMATDIAFSIGALVLLAARVPQSLITFLIALAIVDDLGAVVVIAVFYTEHIALDALLAAVVLLGVLILFNLGGIRKVLPYFIVAALLWYALLQSGIHATLAGVLAAFTIPARPKYDAPLFSRRIRHFVERFDDSHRADSNIMTNDELRTIVHSMEQDARQVGTPLQRMEHAWHLPVAFLIVPVFALCNAGIPIEINQLSTVLRHPVTQGVMAGLVLGKFIGISGASWAALKLGIAQLPAGTDFKQIMGVSLLGGIGFTMAIFIAELGFGHEPELLLMAKTGILAASLLAGVCGFIWLWLAAERKPD